MAPKRPLEPLSPPSTPHKSNKRRLDRTGSTSSPSPYYRRTSSPDVETSSHDSSFFLANSSFLSIPSDSPTNPFGLERVKDVYLPAPTTFGRHVALRFQVVCPSSAARPAIETTRSRNPFTRKRKTVDPQPASRIVQVPANYSFRLLHTLIHFLFSAPSAPSSRTQYTSRPSNSIPDCISKHRFEALTKCVYRTTGTGVIASGRIVAQMSEDSENDIDDEDTKAESAKDLAEDSLAALLSSPSSSSSTSSVKPKTWKWWDEEHARISYLWPKGPDLDRAIIYRPDPVLHPDLAVHISCNTAKLPGRKGVDNLPYVFTADGFLPYSLTSVLGPPPVLGPLKPAPGKDAEYDDEEDEDMDDKKDKGKEKNGKLARTAAPPDPNSAWNRRGVFSRFIAGANLRTRLAMRTALDSRISPSPQRDRNGSSRMRGLDSADDEDWDAGSELEVPIASSPVRETVNGQTHARQTYASSSRSHSRSTRSSSPDDDIGPPITSLSSPLRRRRSEPNLLSSPTNGKSKRARSLSGDWLTLGLSKIPIPMFTPAPAKGSQLDRRVKAAQGRMERLGRRGYYLLEDSGSEEEKAGDEGGGSGKAEKKVAESEDEVEIMSEEDGGLDPVKARVADPAARASSATAASAPKAYVSPDILRGRSPKKKVRPQPPEVARAVKVKAQERAVSESI